MMATRNPTPAEIGEVFDALGRVLEPSVHFQWWGVYVPALGCSPKEATEQGRIEDVLRVARSYLDPSFG